MKKKYFDKVMSKQSYIVICMLFILLNKVSAQKVLDNDILRFGTGAENSVNPAGNLQQPFYFNSTSSLWAKLTYQDYPFDNAYYIDGDGSSEWNTNGFSSINGTLTSQTIDYSKFITTTSPKGYGTIVSKGNITINGSLLEVENTYTLEQNSSFIIINIKIKNIGTAPVSNVRYWSGTKDDFIGTNDNPLKTRGNIVGDAFVPLTTSSDRAKALKLFSGEEGVIIFSNSDRANTIIQICCQWNYVINQNPNTSVVSSGATDGSYGFFVRLNDLAVGESDEFKWYYAAGKVVELEEIIKDIANASGTITDIKYTSAVFKTLSQTDVTGYYVVVPAGSPRPTIAEIKSGVNYGGVNVAASGTSALTANTQKSYPITGLTLNTSYDFYFVTEDGGSSYSTIFHSPFTTPDILKLTKASEDNVSCNGKNDGSASVTTLGGTPTYTYSWSPSGGNGTSATNLSPGNYVVTVTDSNNEMATQNFTITEPDELVATIDTQINADCSTHANGEATVGVTGGTGVYKYSWNTIPEQTTATATGLLPGTYIVTVTDEKDCSTTENATIIVEDIIVPSAIAQNIIVPLDASGNVTINATQIDNGSYDNCGIVEMVLDKTTFNCSNIGPNVVIFMIKDKSGNLTSTLRTVTVEDKIKPNVVTQNITVQLDATGSATITPIHIDNGSNDACGIDSMTLDKTVFHCRNVGTNTVTLTVTDRHGNSATGIAIVTVEDKIKPNVVTKNITVQLDGAGKVSINATDIDNGSNDVCGGSMMILDKVFFDCTNIGVNTVRLTVTDVNGNSASETATVTIEDKIAPTVITKNLTLQLDATGNAIITAADINNGSTDNCGIDSMILDKTTFDCINVGVNTVTLTVTDVNGNSASETAIVTIEDKIVPIVVTQNIVVQLDATGKAIITAAQINNGSSDNCGIDTMILNKTTFDCTNIGVNTVALTVTDINGNSKSETATVTIEDKIAPNVITQNINVQLDATGNATINATQIENGSTDNCGIDTIILDKTIFDCTNIGANTATLTVTDINGNSASETAIVTIEDKIAPTVITKNITAQLDATGSAIISTADIDNGSSDVCGIDSMILDKTTFDCTNVGVNTVTLTVTDVNGNSASETATVTIEDKIAPTVITKSIIVQPDATGNTTINATQIDNGSTDNCGIDTMILDKTTYDCTNVGINNVTLTVTDKNGNSATGTAVVTIKDLIAPNVITQNITVQLDATGNAAIIPALINNGSNDACSIDMLVLDKTAFTCSDIGTNTVTLTVTDFNRNSASGTAVVTVEDKIIPTVITQDITVQLNVTGTVSITVNEINNGSTDNCTIDKMLLDKTTFDCSNIGINTVTLTVIDQSGNRGSATAIVTILPIPEPTFPSLTQEFCLIDAPKIRDIAVNDSINLKWFIDATSAQSLSLNTSIISGTYYAATNYGNCYSNRIPVTIIVKDTLAPTGNDVQYICKEKEATITDLITNEQEVLWYETATGGVPLTSTTILEDKHKYYASYIGAECESSKRLEVEIIIRYCDVVVYNGISANGDGKNDSFFVEGATTFPDNKLEIFNSWGSLVYEASRYGQDDNLFKGFGNKGLGNGTGLLPYGTYYYVFSFTNHDNKRITKTGFLHLNP
ncbi:gliding motility-associated C-terminal domain-containing protein [Flavobacterium sp. KMS]|uniref:T9SS type B sorting domain-containing protein n=1 Tax=Flavobacterium sp. KMS TaxID=1566023 RepID=UPI00057F8F2E|nr:gliding motility-associated C-terminal domain-containing protein [Flavobacterium sp. KMS]